MPISDAPRETATDAVRDRDDAAAAHAFETDRWALAVLVLRWTAVGLLTVIVVVAVLQLGGLP